jgi:tight adherence protein B
MFGLDPTVLMIMMCAMVAVGGLAYVFLFSSIELERNTERRVNSLQKDIVTDHGSKLMGGGSDPAKRRKALEASIKEADKKRANRDLYMKKPPISVQMKQAGMSGDLKKFYTYSAITGGVVCVIALFFGLGMMYLPAVFLIGMFGLPRWFVARQRRRRVDAFLKEFPNALDVLVRAVKSGLPLNDGVRLLANESQEPVRTEFKRIMDGQAVGKSIPQACLEMQETVPCSEAAFFGIVIQIQSQAGGNLSEALGNLSKVIRDRKKMKAKIQALSMEAKASAYIIGSLPFIIGILVQLSTPDYIEPLFVTSTGHIILAVGLTWMSIGILVMKQMINFDF